MHSLSMIFRVLVLLIRYGIAGVSTLARHEYSVSCSRLSDRKCSVMLVTLPVDTALPMRTPEEPVRMSPSSFSHWS